tara:strand:- start:12353 stop:12883 length:531 start_codon:yes stop_codon:yes gene_type:complete
MKFLTSFLLGSSLFLTSAPKIVDDHAKLWDSLERAGVNIVLNDVDFCGDDLADGAYIPVIKALVVCQDNASPLSSRQVDWTSNDLDTLRHESHHVVQDCLLGELGDGESEPLFNTRESLKSFVDNILSEEQIDRIVTNYRELGFDREVIIMEIEAFAVASGVSPDKIADAINKFCN